MDRQYIYYFSPNPQPTVRSDGLTVSKRMILSSLYSAFQKHHFSVHEGAVACGMQDADFSSHAVNFVERGILTTKQSLGQPSGFVLTIAPRNYPEFFTFGKPKSTYHSYTSPSTASIPLAAASA